MNPYEILGLEEKEYKTYLLLVDKGELSQANIAKYLDISKTTAKTLCDSFMEKGWLKALDLGERTLYRAENPEAIHTQTLRMRENAFEKLKDDFIKKRGYSNVRVIENTKDLLPIQNDFRENAVVTYYLNDANEYLKRISNNNNPKSKESNKKYYKIFSTHKKDSKMGDFKYKSTDDITLLYDEKEKIESIIEIWNDSVYISNSLEASTGIYIKNKPFVNTFRFLLKQLINKKDTH